VLTPALFDTEIPTYSESNTHPPKGRIKRPFGFSDRGSFWQKLLQEIDSLHKFHPFEYHDQVKGVEARKLASNEK